ncbi:MAG: hypothetical protein K6T90_10230 [Leptolyngbyaceae cyanobacterium HOT.MB2.61]|nr:hypothetical protein [Leptolyngbyaceae cyanobacterium HOT.MB2.61]
MYSVTNENKGVRGIEGFIFKSDGLMGLDKGNRRQATGVLSALRLLLPVACR